MEQYSPIAARRVSRAPRVFAALVIAMSDMQGLTRRQAYMGVPNDAVEGPIFVGCSSEIPPFRGLHFPDKLPGY